MDNFSWMDCMQFNRFLLRICGLWPSGDKSYGFDLYTVYSGFVNIMFGVMHNILQGIGLWMILDDLAAVTAVIFIAFIQVIAVIKAYYIFRHMKTVKKLMVTLRSEMFQPKNFEQRELIQDNLNTFRNINIAFWTPACFTFFFWATFPILDKSVKEYKLPFLVWYPWNTKKSPFYEFTYIYQLTCVYFIAFVSITVDMFVASLNMYVGAQCDLLCDNLSHLDYTNPAVDMKEELLKCIRHHKEIISFTKDSNDFYNWIVLTQFFTSGVSIGMTMFQMTVVTPFSSQFLSLFCYGFAICIEIFVYCFFGNDVELKSSNIPYAIFQSNWIDADPVVKKHMIYFVLRCQTPIKVSALNLFYLTLDTFVRILRTAWSYFAVLHQVNSAE